MANVDAPFGFNPVGSITGGPWNGQTRMYTIDSGDSTAVYIGDPVKLTGASTLNADGTVTANVIKAATTDVIVGVVTAVLFDTRDSLIYRAASTTRRVLVADDPNTLFEIQEISTGTALTKDDVANNISFSAGTPSTVTGRSGAVLNNATEAGTNTLGLKIVGVANRPNNVVGDGATVFVVRINRHQYVDQVAGV
jgi:hypothetical protein